MASQALYNKWRGQTFDDILGQEHVTRTLQNQIRAGRIGHAYLFTGLRGTGKTSMARILAKAINCVGGVDNPPCNQCHICRSITEGRSLDLVEIDGASNRGVDEIRELRDRVNFSPSECRYKVYVIDEVHMLTREAFNALLKTLEEPPAHVVFVLCTTEPHRLPDTVLSRCQRFDFRRGSLGDIMAKLRNICAAEGITIRDEALEFIARRATGSFRDAESLLEQMVAFGEGEITLEQVQAVLGTVSWALVDRVVGALVARDIPTGLEAINEAFDGGAEPHQLVSDILDHLRALMFMAVGGSGAPDLLPAEVIENLRKVANTPGFSLGLVVKAIKQFSEAGQRLRYSVRPELPLELALVEAVLSAEGEGVAGAVATGESRGGKGQDGSSVPAPEPEERAVAAAHAEPASEEVGEVTLGAVPIAESASEVPAPDRALTQGPATAQVDRSDEGQGASADTGRPLSLERVRGYWPKVLIQARSRNAQVQALLKSTEPVEVREDSTIVLACEAEFHRDKLSQGPRRDLVEEMVSEVLGLPCRIECVVSEEYRRARYASPGDIPEDLFEAADPGLVAERRLLNHPAVKELQRRGGVVRRVRLGSAQEEKSGQ